METLIEAVKGTPWWVYPIFVYLLIVGIQALKPQIVSIGKLFILPIVLIAWSIFSLITGFEGWVDLFFWALAIVAGFFIGCSLAGPYKKLRADRKKLLAYVPGSRLVLILLMVIFAVKYFFGYYRASHEEPSSVIQVASILAYGAITGIFVGRLYMLLKHFAKAKHENLKKGGNPRKKSLL